MKNNKIKRYNKRLSIKWLLVFYDLLVYAFTFTILNVVEANKSVRVDGIDLLYHIIVSIVCIFTFRFIFKIYKQVWRYGGVSSYMLLIASDGVAFVFYYFIQKYAPFEPEGFYRCLALISVDLLLALIIRMVYRFLFKYCRKDSSYARLLFKVINFLGRTDITIDEAGDTAKIKIAILGAGRVGSTLAESLVGNPNSHYMPILFIDKDQEKIGRMIHMIPVVGDEEANPTMLIDLGVQEVVFAVQNWDAQKKKEIYKKYKDAGLKIKTYDYPTVADEETGGKRRLREFDIEELLFRNPLVVINEQTTNFYKDKVVLITGGGGSIGSELCRQIAKMSPKQIVILDVYENGAYDVQQELKIKYAGKLNLQVEILSICNRVAMDRVFAIYRPNIVVMAAAHKHVPLMEHNIVEAVENNIFGTLNTVELAEKYNVDRVHMVSTDKAVNPTSVMGATKRFCEYICQAHSTKEQHTTFSITRFGNVLGSAGSVIPLFKRQIAAGGPITLTDYRIIRYFMTIPEASQLVLCSSAMAKNGELFVLDMGQPVKIYDLAVNMIKLSGFEVDKDIKIIETGLRPGEKLYEELLVKSEELDKTDNELIFIERDKPISIEELDVKLSKLTEGINIGDDANMKNIIKEVVPTFIEKEQANKGFDGKEVK